MTPHEATAAHLDQAAEEIRQHGWCQGHMFGEGGRVCALGAIVTAAGEGPLAQMRGLKPWLAAPGWVRADRALTEYLRSTGEIDPAADHWDGSSCMSVGAWNDQPDRTQMDVINAMEKAAAWVREQA